jgi:RND family efflux transporter MFP subunit
MSTPTPSRSFTLAGRILLPLLLLGIGAAAMKAAVQFGRKAAKAPIETPMPDVELITATTSDYPVTLQSQGVIEAITQTRAAAEVAGRVASVSPAWREGAHFRKGDELLRLDEADYAAAVANAEAAAAEAAMQVRMEEARAEQALRDWKKLAAGNPESDLVTRAPQLKAARARAAASNAAIEKAKRDLARTVVRAPFDGRMLRTLINVGSWAAPGAALAEFYATDRFQVRLPLPLDDFTLLESPEGTPVTLTATAGGRTVEIKAALTRTAGEIDRASRTLPVTAEFDASSLNDPLIAPGLYVNASLPGKTLRKVIRLPRRSLLAGDRVAVCSADHHLSFRPVRIARTTRDDVLLAEGVQQGERILATTLAVMSEGMAVRPVTADPATP